MIYYIFLGILFILSLIEILPLKTVIQYREKRILCIMIIIALIVIAGFRDGIGIDYDGYHGYFIRIQNGSLGIINKSFEPILSILFRFVSSFRLCILIIALVSVSMKGKIFLKQNSNYGFTALFFYYATEYLFYDMGIVRQGMAVAVCLTALPYVVRKDKRFFILIIIATCIHISSIVYILMWFLGNKEYSRKFYYGFALVSFAIYESGKSFTSYLVPLMSGLGILSSKMWKFSQYAEVDITISVIRRILFLVMFVELFKRDINIYIGRKSMLSRKPTESTWLYINSFFMSTVLLSIFGTLFSSMAGRMTECLYISYIFLYMEILSNKNKTIGNILFFLVFGLLAFIAFKGTVVNHESFYIPYKILINI